MGLFDEKKKGLFDDDDDELDALLDAFLNKRNYPHYVKVLNEGNVQNLFNNCIANASTQEVVTSFLFPKAFGYDGSEKPIRFDKALLLKNKKSIEYLFGQMHRVHFPAGSYKMTADDFNTTYQGIYWADSVAALLKLLYLGVTPEVLAITPFKADTSTSVLSPSIKPTLSPNDPNFSRWWEENKAQWE